MNVFSKNISLVLLLLTGLNITRVANAQIPSNLTMDLAPPRSLPYSAKLYVDMETKFNPNSVRDNRPFWIEHLEIPIELLEEDVGRGLDAGVHNSLVFSKEGKKYLSWILNPEDTQYGTDLVAKFALKGIRLDRKKYYIGYLTLRIPLFAL